MNGPKEREMSSDKLREVASNAREEAASETTDREDRSKAGDDFANAVEELQRRGEE